MSYFSPYFYILKKAALFRTASLTSFLQTLTEQLKIIVAQAVGLAVTNSTWFSTYPPEV